MPTVTLAESAKLSQDMLVAGVIEQIITVNRMFEVLPFNLIEGNSLAYNREQTLGDVGFYGVGDDILAKNPATFTQITTALTSMIGDAEVNGLIQATRSNINDQKAVQIASKAKALGRQYQTSLITGDGTANTFQGLQALCPAANTLPAGGPLTFALLDQLIDLITDKDGEVDYFQMHSRDLRKYYADLRALGGASISEVVTLPSGATVPAYRNVPIFRNDYIPTTLGGGTESAIFAGTLDDGSMSMGISGITAENASGIQIQEVGISETRDETITRVKWYCGMALYNENGLACLTGVTP